MRPYIYILVLICAGHFGLAFAAAPKVLIIGDSLSTAYGLNQDEGWTNVFAQQIAEEKINAQVINASISGQTTAAGLAQLPQLLTTHQPRWLLLELGGNDGLQGLPIAHIENNLSQMITLAQTQQVNVLLIGMRLPPNYGPRYTAQFADIFPALAKRYDISLVPFLLDNVGGYEEYMQHDGIHPDKKAQAIIADTVWPYAQALLMQP